MSLFVYMNSNEVPENIELVRYNDLFFKKNYIADSMIARRVLKEVEHADYVDGLNFKDRFEHTLSKDNLSTGTKTLLNIINYPNKCFDSCECGQNALYALRHIRQGHVVVTNPFIYADSSDHDCDIIFRGRLFTDWIEWFDFMEDAL